MTALLIFDFDGVVADTEVIANRALAAALTEIGLPTSIEDAMEAYMGRHWADCATLIEARLGHALPAGWTAAQQARIAEMLAVELTEVAGLTPFLDTHDAWPRCIASSSSRRWIGDCLDRLGLAARFERRFSGAEDVARGKPFPDLFLHAAAACGIAPDACVVIEDSRHGVAAGVAAGMRVIGLTAGSHARPGDAARLQAAGAHAVAANWDEVAALLRTPQAGARQTGIGSA